MSGTTLYPTVVHMLIDAAEKTPEQEALVAGEERLNYRQFLNCAIGFSNELVQLDGAGERVALIMANSIDMCIAMFGAQMAGAQIVPMNPMYTEHELRPMLEDAEVRVIVYDKSNRGPVEKLAKELNIPDLIFIDAVDGRRLIEWVAKPGLPLPEVLPGSDDLATLQFTGGTTGRAKGANLSHSALAKNMHQCNSLQNSRMDVERVLCVMPLFHCYAWSVCLYNMVNCRGTVVILAKYHPQEVLDTFGTEKITIFAGSPTMFTGLMNYETFNKADFSHLTKSNSGSAPLAEELLNKWEQVTGTPILEGYGQTEASPVISFNPSDGIRKPGSVGVAVPDTEIQIVDMESGNTQLAAGEKGEIRLRGPQVMLGYRNRPQETAESLRDGWLYTGDIGFLDEDAYLFITGRKKEMILMSGYNVFPREIEELLFLYPGIKEAAVVGKKDDYRGELPIAFIVPVDDEALNKEQLRGYCEENLAAYKVPDEFRIVSFLPKTAVGKVDKISLSDMANNEVKAE
jgi:long-chain acyl-CoA synthetase